MIVEPDSDAGLPPWRALNVGIDGYNLALPRGTGIATYGLNLAQTLQSGGHRISGLFGLAVGADVKLRETMFFDAVARPATARTQFGGRWQRRLWMTVASTNPWLVLRARDVPLSPLVDKDTYIGQLPHFDRLTSAKGLFPLAHRHFVMTGRFLTVHLPNPPDIMHWTCPLPIRVANTRNVYTIHDLVPLRLPYTTLGNKPYFRRLVSACAREADHICTISEYTRNDVINNFQVDDEVLTNIYQTACVSDYVLTETAEQSNNVVRNSLGLLANEFFLYFGSIEPKKNIGRLLEAYLSLGLQRPLVIVGARAWLADKELALLENHADHARSDISQRIVQIDYLSRDLLARVIRSARAVLFPSISEGFGLPILEAMQLGTPVLTSNRGAPAEIAGDAALLVNPYDINDIAAGIRRLDEDNQLRCNLSAAGRERAGHFTMHNFRERLETMYAHVLRR